MSVLEKRIRSNAVAILMAIMDDERLLLSAKQHLHQDDFADSVQRAVWNKIVELDKQNKKYDLYSVTNPEYTDSVAIEKLAQWERDDLYVDCDLKWFEERVIDYCNLVDRERTVNALNVLSTEIVDGKIKDSQQIGEKLNSLSLKAYKLHPKHTTGYAGETIVQDIKELSNLSKNGVPFGIDSIDKQMGTLNKSQFILIAARPGTGKSSLFLYPLAEFCRRGMHVCLNTMEMTRAEMIVRVLANRSNVMMNKITGLVSAEQFDGERIAKAVEEVKQWKLTIIEQGLNTPSQIDAYLTRCEAEKNPVELLILDHFGLLMPDGKASNNRYTDYTNISNDLKRLAKKHKTVILCLTQINRIDECQKPTKENMRDTGSLEQDADKIIAMWRDNNDKNTVNIGLIKNRQGVEFETQLRFYGSTMHFYETVTQL